MRNKSKILVVILLLACIITGLTACDNKGVLTIEFHVDGKIYKSLQVKADETLTMPAQPIKEDYDFKEWYVSTPSMDESFDADSITKYRNQKILRVYARFVPKGSNINTYIIQFQLSGGDFVSGGGELLQTIANGQNATAPSNPTRAGYDFIGWSPTLALTNIQSNAVYEAQWESTKSLKKLYEQNSSIVSEVATSLLSDSLDNIVSASLVTPHMLNGLSQKALVEIANGVVFSFGNDSIYELKYNTVQNQNKFMSYCSKVGIKAVYDENLGYFYTNEALYRVFTKGATKVDESYYIVDNELLTVVDRNVETLELSSQVKTINKTAFEKCSQLSKIKISNSVIDIPIEVFTDCIALSTIEVDSQNAVYKALDGNLYSADGATLIYYPLAKSDKNMTVASGTTAIGNDAFFGNYYLEEIILPDSLISIGDNSFANCLKLNKLIIPARLTTIGNGAFEHCDMLANIELPQSLTSIGDSAFANCDMLVNIELPQSLTTIGASAFANCDMLANIKLPQSLTSIGDSAFDGCSNLKIITIPKTVTTIGYYAFTNCYNLNIYAEATSKPSGWDYYWNYGCKSITWGYLPY